MKRYIIIFLLFACAAVVYLGFPRGAKQGYVKLDTNGFSLNDSSFFPIVVNYIVSTRADKDGMWATPYFGYTPDSLPLPISKEACLKELKADMELIHEMGFNTVRILQIGDEDVENKNTGVLLKTARLPDGRDTSCYLNTERAYNNYFDALQELFGVIDSAGLRSIFKVHLIPEIYSTEEHLTKVARRFSNERAIMAYDLFNEPLYFDSLLERTKENVHATTKRWRKIITMYAPNHLTTIGLAGIREVFRWDPNILDIDFISFHPYDHEPGQVMSELYWYGKIMQKPWIVGETAIAADNDSITYEEQKQFASKTLAQTKACGGKGYSWWQYKDVDWKSYMANFMGAVTRKGESKTKKSGLIVQGMVKPVAEVFRTYSEGAVKTGCSCPDNYLNYSKGNMFRLTGKLVDETGGPIPNGVVLAWDKGWYPSYHTTTKDDGTFELLGKCKFYHWIASASNYSVIRGEILADTLTSSNKTVPAIDLGRLQLERLQYK